MHPVPVRRAPIVLTFPLLVGGLLGARTSLAGTVPSPHAMLAIADPSLEPRRAGDGRDGGASPAPFGLFLDGEPLPFRVNAFTLLPGELVRVSAPPAVAGVLRHQAGRAHAAEPGLWSWRAPQEPGIYALRLESARGAVDLTALVLHPASSIRAGKLGDYPIGQYRQTPLRGDPAYLPPVGFVEVAAADADVLVSPHFSLGQFLCHQPGSPRYLALTRALVGKLESITSALAERGIPRGSLEVMSGFRTPAYNQAIGNTTVYSRHLWGDAADVYVDADGNGEMDDLDGDGRSTVADAHVLARWVDELATEGDWRPGGMGTYGPNTAHGPFVHVDARGTRARW
jgi:hypothetical protein